MNSSHKVNRPEADVEAPGELHTQADDEPALTHREAEVAGIVPGMVVYGDSSLDPNADDKRDSEHAAPDEHV
ncbi:MAG: hypothetical protein GIX03_14280 [Candidatus Eremiobacteraeota bacterium]|nr:hypothetical protein [Candidatus Eremiobacteraeota bacterium]MBC5804136.1 hypothetical protein [Candidatus Eremiobacteraeota bacterium]MBC5821811.1 hypothetical protein [Candidatus Eremiobacteraeota bacterium]